MTAIRNNRGLAHENGSGRGRQPPPQDRARPGADAARLPRLRQPRRTTAASSREVVARRNAPRSPSRSRIERAALRALPERRSADFIETEARVTRASAFTVRGVLYSAPSRLIGHRLKVRLYHDRLECYLGASLVLTVPRGHPPAGQEPRPGDRLPPPASTGLKRKPQALRA